jgi:hypothetical protein
VTSSALATDAEQLELRNRLFADAEVARFAGFVPGLIGGFDVFQRSGTEADSVVVPFFGAAIRRTSF